MNTRQTRFINLSAKKVTNTDHTAMNDNHSKYLTSLFFDCLTTYQNGELGRTASILSCQ